MVKYCTEGKHIATEFCPEETVKEVAVLNYERALVTKNGSAIKENDTAQKQVVKAKDHAYLLQTVSLGELCPKHKEAPEPILPEIDPDNPLFPGLPGIPGGEGGEGSGEGSGGEGNTGTGEGNTGEGNTGTGTTPTLNFPGNWGF